MSLLLKKLIKGFSLILFFTFIYFLPFLIISWINKPNIINKIENLPKAEAVLIFGTVVRDGKISPLLEERLEAGKQILDQSKTETIVVSNMEVAANIMANYLYEADLSPDLIDIDPQAEQTPDTCKFEKSQHPENRKVIFVSQKFHLPRLIFQCKKAGVTGVGFPAEAVNITDGSQYSTWTKLTVRSKRYFREAGLTWLALLNIYQ